MNGWNILADIISSTIIFAVPLLVVAEQGREWGWTSPGVLGLIALGIVGVIAFILIEIRMKDEALIPMRLFRSRVFSTGLAANVFIGLGMFGALSTLPLYLQLVFGSTPTESGFQMLPMILGLMTASILSGQIIARTGHYRIFPILARLDPAGKTSMLQDVEARRNTEVEIFAGTVVELGRRHGVPTPVNEVLGELLVAAERLAGVGAAG